MSAALGVRVPTSRPSLPCRSGTKHALLWKHSVHPSAPPQIAHRKDSHEDAVATERGVLCRAAASCCAAAAAGSAAVASAAFMPVPVVNLVVMVLTVYHLAMFALMQLMHKSWPVRSFFRSVWPYLPLAITYGVLLANSWAPDTLSVMMPGSLSEGLSGGFKPQFFPRIESIMTLFQRPATAASWLVHIWAVNLHLGRTIFLEGADFDIPTRHSLVLAAVLGPLGLLSHMITKALWKPPVGPVVLTQGDSSITLLPYQQL